MKVKFQLKKPNKSNKRTRYVDLLIHVTLFFPTNMYQYKYQETTDIYRQTSQKTHICWCIVFFNFEDNIQHESTGKDVFMCTSVTLYLQISLCFPVYPT
jgi:hypothetical protein